MFTLALLAHACAAPVPSSAAPELNPEQARWWDGGSTVMSFMGGITEWLRPPFPSMMSTMKMLQPRRVLEVGTADTPVLLSALALAQATIVDSNGPRLCGAGINSLAYFIAGGKEETVKQCQAGHCPKNLYGSIGIWMGQYERRNFEKVAQDFKLPMPTVTPNVIGCDVHYAGLPFVSDSVDLIITQNSLDKFYDTPVEYSSVGNKTTRGFSGAQVEHSMLQIAHESERVLSVGGLAHLQLASLGLDANVSKHMMLQATPAFDGTMVPLMMGSGVTSLHATDDDLRLIHYLRNWSVYERPERLHRVCRDEDDAEDHSSVSRKAQIRHFQLLDGSMPPPPPHPLPPPVDSSAPVHCVAAILYVTNLTQRPELIQTKHPNRGQAALMGPKLMLFMHKFRLPDSATGLAAASAGCTPNAVASAFRGTGKYLDGVLEPIIESLSHERARGHNRHTPLWEGMHRYLKDFLATDPHSVLVNKALRV